MCRNNRIKYEIKILISKKEKLEYYLIFLFVSKKRLDLFRLENNLKVFMQSRSTHMFNKVKTKFDNELSEIQRNFLSNKIQ